MKQKVKMLLGLGLLLALIAACTPQEVEVTRVVEVESDPEVVEVEVTRVIEVEGDPEVVEVEVTRVVEAEAEMEANPERVIEGVEEGAEIVFWTWFLSPTFDDYINDTIVRFNEAYPEVTVIWEDQTELPDKYRNSLAAGNAPDVINLSSGWVPEFAENDQLVNMSEALPDDVKSAYFEGLFNVVNYEGNSYQVPWYQALTILVYNGQIVEEAGLTAEDLPTTYDELVDVCRTIKDTTGQYCTAPNLLEGDSFLKILAYNDVAILSEDGSEVLINSEEGVATLQFWIDMLNEDLIPLEIVTQEHRTMIEGFSAGQFAFMQTGPQLIRLVRENNPGLYGFLGVAPNYLGASGVASPSSMSLVVTADTEYPNASLALATFMTNELSQLEFAKTVAVYPATPGSFEDEFFTTPGAAIEDSARPIARDAIASQVQLMPVLPDAPEILDILNNEAQRALLGQATAQEALDSAAEQINEILADS